MHKKKPPEIKSKREVFTTPWISVIEKKVDLGNGEEPYYAIAARDYLAVFAVTPDGKAVIVRQYRPAVERFTYEIPAGMVEDNETPESAAKRELSEETGFKVKDMRLLGSFDPDTGRYQNRQHTFFAITETGAAIREPEKGISVELWTMKELEKAISDGRFNHVLHQSVVLYANHFLFGGALFSKGLSST